jgi:hypothetical protein
MSAYTNHGKTTSVKRNSGRNSTLTETDRRTLRRIISKKSQEYCSTGRVKLNIHLENFVSTKTGQREIHKSNIHGWVATAKPVITESNAEMRKR